MNALRALQLLQWRGHGEVCARLAMRVTKRIHIARAYGALASMPLACLVYWFRHQNQNRL